MADPSTSLTTSLPCPLHSLPSTLRHLPLVYPSDAFAQPSMRLRLYADSPDATAKPIPLTCLLSGESIRGRLEIVLCREDKVRGIRLRLLGEANYTVKSSTDDNDVSRHIEFLSMRRTLWGVLRSQRGGHSASILPAGLYRFPVWFPPIQESAPPSVHLPRCTIRYSLRGYMDRPRRSDWQVVRNFTTSTSGHIPAPPSAWTTRTQTALKTFLFSSGDVRVSATIPRSAFSAGETDIPVIVSVENNSEKTVSSISAVHACHVKVRLPDVGSETRYVHGPSISWPDPIASGSSLTVTLQVTLREDIVSVSTHCIRLENLIRVCVSYSLPSIATTFDFPIVVRAPEHHSLCAKDATLRVTGHLKPSAPQIDETELKTFEPTASTTAIPTGLPCYPERELAELLPLGWSRALLVNKSDQCEAVVFLDHMSRTVHREVPYEYRTALLSAAELKSGLSSSSYSPTDTKTAQCLIYPHVQLEGLPMGWSRDVTSKGVAYFVDHIARRTLLDAHGQLTIQVEDISGNTSLAGLMVEVRLGGVRIGSKAIESTPFDSCSLQTGVTSLTVPLELCLVDPRLATTGSGQNEQVASAFIHLLEMGTGSRSRTMSVNLVTLSHQLSAVSLSTGGGGPTLSGDEDDEQDDWVDLSASHFGTALIRLVFVPASGPLLEEYVFKEAPLDH
mmetsp:Transcript_13158/g.39764  ORF Transcript_13158/g.39764 Transcript_13158/m.39764 type:complete len:675 (-) Transcript_13158:2400-4424(-)